jgi:pyruvate/2-oxoglutarate dehydrogenase complex dihydrolipoamide acyltransferase (E2) component
MGSGSSTAMPVVKAVESKGLTSISKQLVEYEKKLFSSDANELLTNQQVNSVGTFAIYNLGMYIVNSSMLFT